VVFSGFGFGLMIIALFLLPETKGRSLASLEAAEPLEQSDTTQQSLGPAG
jgi:hypothetical protein